MYYNLLFPLRRARFNDQDGGGGEGGTGGTGGDGGEGGTNSWHSKLPEDLRVDPSLVGFKDESELIPMPINVARSYVNTKKLVGRDKIPMPKTPEEWEEAYTRLGRPESPEHYSIALDESLDVKVKPIFEEELTWFKPIAHKYGLNDTQAREMFQEYVKKTMDTAGKQTLDFQEAIRQSETDLRNTYGSAFEGKLVLMNRGIEELDRRVGGGFKDLIKDIGVEKSSAFIKSMVIVGEMMAEDLGLDKSTGGPRMEAATLDDTINTLKADPAYVDGKHPNHQAVVTKMAKLMQQKHGTKPVDSLTRESFLT